MAIVSNEQCVLCGEQAAVRVSGTSFCASCGLSQYRTGASERSPMNRRSRRAAIIAFFSSGIFIKGLLGAVALAAVGGAAANSVLGVPIADSVPADTSTATWAVPATVDPPPDPAAIISITETTIVIPRQPEVAGAVAGFVAAVEAWVDCVYEAVAAHPAEAFDPEQECPGKPNPDDYGLIEGEDLEPDTSAGVDGGDGSGSSDGAPGHDEDGPGNSEDAPGHDEDGPGNSEDAPGHDEDGPGNSEDAPGHDDGGPGNSEDAPGHDEDGPGNSDQSPGNGGDSGLEA